MRYIFLLMFLFVVAAGQAQNPYYPSSNSGKKSFYPSRKAKKDGADLAKEDLQNKIVKRFDENGDGQLDEQETANARKTLENFKKNYPQLLKEFDKNHDGKLDYYEAQEAKEIVAERKARYQALLQKYDVNHNGKMDSNEIDQAKSDAQQRQPSQRK